MPTIIEIARAYILRGEAYSALQEHFTEGGFKDYTDGQKCMNRIKAIPAADVVEVVRGKWEMNSNYPDRLICSDCGVQFDCWHWEAKQMHYCPSCGAKMDDNVIQHTECVGNALGALDEVEELSRYIDANKMADELSKVPWHDRKDEKQAVRMVKEFPTADVVEVVHGRPVKFYCDARTGRMMTTCSACDMKISPYDRFCKHCGAKMDGGQDDV